MHHPTLCAVAVAVLSALPGAQAGLYTKKSPVVQVDAKNYDRLIAKSNYTSIVEFYAPWCGHCQNLKPAYEKAAKNLEGLAKVAAVNCDEDVNKPFCGSMGVQGFPTLKIVRPKKGGGKPMIQDYNGQRTASAIVDAVVQSINNYVVKVEDKSLDKFLSDEEESPKALLFTDKGTTSALLKSIAIDFADVITVGQVRNKETAAVKKFGVTKFPTLVLLPGGDASPIVYDGELKKDAMVKFLSQAGEPNPDPAPAKAKGDKKEKKEKKEKKSEKAEKATSAKPKSKKTTTAEPEPESTASEPAHETETQQAPVIVETALPIPAIHSQEKLIKECLNEKSHTCVLAFVASNEDETAKKALENLSQLAFKHAQSKRHLFPFYEVSKTVDGVAPLLKSLDINGDVEIIAINARRGWWRHYEGADFGHASVESWIDAIRMGEGAKKKLPEGLIAAAVEETTSAATPKATDSATESIETKATDPTAEPETAAEHDEL
ncbi:protein disulfide-isomerase MPD1 [Cladorrhinum samala]|uniref:protein disulfide-isomerase n=1 Tax=Cladorrhinum samala TaxID=585594 RepID=A0AAV9HSF0_9PEZI|nr:protein disulfide-isomerase MPD1 [Cladorrhinum samala]